MDMNLIATNIRSPLFLVTGMELWSAVFTVLSISLLYTVMVSFVYFVCFDLE